MKLTKLYEQIILENVLDSFKEKNVGDGKQLSNEIFQEIVNVTKNKVNYILWLGKSVINGFIPSEDIYKFGDRMENNNMVHGYITIFDKNKNKFDKKDINLYRTREDIREFINKCIQIREKDIELLNMSAEGEQYVSKKDINRLNEVGIKFHGIIQGYQLFEVPDSSRSNPNAFKRYSEILGKCAGRDKGRIIEICTFKEHHFNRYLNDYPNTSYFVLFNMNDPESPYQVHYGPHFRKDDMQFKDRADNEVKNRTNKELKFIEVLEFIHKLNPEKYKDIIVNLMNIDVLNLDDFRGKDLNKITGTLKYKKFDDSYDSEKSYSLIQQDYVNGVLNGTSKKDYYNQGKFKNSTLIETYKDGERNGPYEYIDYIKYKNKHIIDYKIIANWKNGELNGPFKRIDGNGILELSGYYENDINTQITKYWPNGNIVYQSSQKTNTKMNVELYDENGDLVGVGYELGVYLNYINNAEKFYILGKDKNELFGISSEWIKFEHKGYQFKMSNHWTGLEIEFVNLQTQYRDRINFPNDSNFFYSSRKGNIDFNQKENTDIYGLKYDIWSLCRNDDITSSIHKQIINKFDKLKELIYQFVDKYKLI